MRMRRRGSVAILTLGHRSLHAGGSKRNGASEGKKSRGARAKKRKKKGKPSAPVFLSSPSFE